MAKTISYDAELEKLATQYGTPRHSFREANIGVRNLDRERLTKGTKFTFPEKINLFPAEYNGQSYNFFLTPERVQINPAMFDRIAYAASDDSKHTCSGEVVKVIQDAGDWDAAWPQLAGRTAIITDYMDIACVDLSGNPYSRRLYQIDWAA